MDDFDLLRDYVRNRSQDAFQQLVTRHLPMVLSAARRLVRDTQLAEEIAQSVFTTFARKADFIRPPQVVGGWLYNTTRHLAAHTVRTEQRRREREQNAIDMQTIHPALASAPGSPFSLELLEPAMAELDAEDRDALVLRFLEERSLREVGSEFGITEDAARMRVNRALERLRLGFEKHGIKTTPAILAAALTAGTVSVPATLGAAISSIALAGIPPAIAATAGSMALGTVQKIAMAGVLACVVAVGIYQAHQSSRLRKQVGVLESGLALANEQREQLIRDREDATRQQEDRARGNDTQRDVFMAQPEPSRPRRLPRTPAPQQLMDDSTNSVRVVSAVILTNRGPQWPQWITQEQLRARMKTQPGNLYDRMTVDNDVRALYATGLFSNIRAIEDGTPESVVLTFVVQEQPNLEPGKYITKEQLAFAGYKTPEASLQSLTWAMVAGNWEMMKDNFVSELAPAESEREQFETASQTIAPLFKGIQILARKELSPENVELKVLIDSGTPLPNSPEGREVQVQKLTKAGVDWKVSGNTHAYAPEWDESGTIQSLGR